MMDQFYEIFMLFGICLATPLMIYLIFIAVKKPMPVRSWSCLFKEYENLHGTGKFARHGDRFYWVHEQALSHDGEHGENRVPSVK